MEKTIIFVTSDIHSDTDALKAVIEAASEEKATKLLIAGDLCPKNPQVTILLHNAPFSFITVKGNCDWMWDYKDSGLALPQEYSYIPYTGDRHIAMTHGHSIYSPEDFPFTLKKGDIFIQGHTHVPALFEDEKGIIRLNPGSPSRPRGGYKASYAVIKEDRIEIRKLKNGKKIMELEQ